MEIIFAIFLLSGLIKTTFEFLGFPFPVDLTLLTSAILGLHLVKCIFSFIKYKKPLSPHFVNSFGLLILFFAWALFTLYYSKSTEYGPNKAFFFLLNVIALSYPFFNPSFKIKRFLKTFFLIILLFSVAFIPYQILYDQKILTAILTPERLNLVAGHYLTLGELSGLVLVYFYSNRQHKLFSPLIDRVLVLFTIVLLVALGARGPFLFTLIVLFFYSVTHFSIKSIKIRLKDVYTAIGAIIVMGFLIFQFSDILDSMLDRTIMRFEILAESIFDTSTDDQSIGERFDHFSFAFNGIFSDENSLFFGYGLGSYGIMHSGLDTREYPHNFILEIMFETGLIGLVLFFAFLLYFFKFIRMKSQSYNYWWCIGLMLLNMLKSNSIVDIRVLFAFLSFMLISAVWQKSEKQMPPVAVEPNANPT